jgi:hypothetical protein
MLELGMTLLYAWTPTRTCQCHYAVGYISPRSAQERVACEHTFFETTTDSEGGRVGSTVDGLATSSADDAYMYTSHGRLSRRFTN